MVLADFGATDGWAGHRATKAWYGLFGNSAADLQASTEIELNYSGLKGINGKWMIIKHGIMVSLQINSGIKILMEQVGLLLFHQQIFFIQIK
jgi:hypothetical protein